MKDTISHCRQSLSILVMWLAEVDYTVPEPKDLFDIEGYENVAKKIYSISDKKEIVELVNQCRIVGLKELASHFEMSLGIATLEGSQELMNNN